MKTIVAFMLALSSVVALNACKQTKETTTTSTTTQTSTHTTDSLFAEIRRTPCFGRCPVYTITVYKSGYVTYDAVKWTSQEGYFVGRLSADQMQSLAAKAKEIGYFKLADKYDNPGVSDLPSVITTLNYEGKKKKITNRVDGPEVLKEFERFFDGLFVDMVWEQPDPTQDPQNQH